MAVAPSDTRIADLVRGDEPLDVAEQATLDRFKEAALVVEAARLGSASGLSDATRTMIVEHLTAHYWELGPGGGALKSERWADRSETYDAEAMRMLASTRNGRIVMELDTTGALGEAAKPKPSFVVL